MTVDKGSTHSPGYLSRMFQNQKTRNWNNVVNRIVTWLVVQDEHIQATLTRPIL